LPALVRAAMMLAVQYKRSRGRGNTQGLCISAHLVPGLAVPSPRRTGPLGHT
jgi:hypothetical protein